MNSPEHTQTGAGVREGLPPRFQRPKPFTYVLVIFGALLVIHGATQGALLGPEKFFAGFARTGNFLSSAFPPSVDRLGPVLHSMLVTFEMALIGTILGVGLSLVLGVLAAANIAPHRSVYYLSRIVVTVCRTIPDLVWALIFVVAVGLGPQAGVLAIMVDVMGLCARFFADQIEEIDQGIIDSLQMTGASQIAVILAGVIPACLPSFVATSLFGLEQATRSSVVLGIVGAGGIGVELNVSMQLLRYDEALTIILAIFIVVVAVERVSAEIRRRILQGNR